MKNFGKEKNQFANMPQSIVHEKLSRIATYGSSEYPDTMEGMDKQLKNSISKTRSNKSKQK